MNPALATLIHKKKKDILHTWRIRARQGVPAARELDTTVLTNNLPEFLEQMGRVLSLHAREKIQAELGAARDHARQRAGLYGYSINEVIEEYHLLRQVIIETLESESPLPHEDHALIIDCIDHAIKVAATHYIETIRTAERETENKYRRLIEGVKDYAIFGMDPQGNITSWNEGAWRIKGYSEEEIVGKNFSIFYTPEDLLQGKPERGLKFAAEHGEWHDEGWRLRKNGSRFWASVVITALHDEGRLLGFTKITRDLTEQKKTEADLRLREQERFQLAEIVAQTAADAFFLIDTSGCVTFANPASEEMFGYTLEEMQNKTLHDLIHSKHPDGTPYPMSECPIGQVMTSGVGIRNHEDQFLRKDGTFLPVLCSNAPVYEEGRLVGAVLVVHDLTEKKRLEENFVYSLRHARCILWNAEVVRLETPYEENGQQWWLQWRDFALNESSAQEVMPLDMPPGADYAAAWRLCRHPEDDARMQQTSHDAFLSGLSAYRQEFRCTDRDGREHWMYEVVSIQKLEENRWRAVGVVTDITDQKRTEEALKQNNERLLLLSETANRLLEEEDPQRFIRQLYDRLSRHLDLEIYLNYLVTENGEELDLASYSGINEADARKVGRMSFGEAICGQVAQIGEQIIVEDIQNTPHPMTDLVRSVGITAYACLPLIAEEKLIGTLSFGTRKRATFLTEDLDLLQTVANQVALALERARLLSELQKQTDALLQADESKNRFLAMLAHELRNPLAPLLNSLYLLDQKGDDTAARERIRDVMTRQIRHMARLIDDLLDVSRISRGKIQMQTQVFDFRRLAQEVAEDHRSEFERAGIDFSLDVPEQALPVEGDYTRLFQVMGNLLGNARKFTEAGGRVRIRVQEREGQVAVSVKDTGIGIDADLLPHLFEIFTQADQSLDRSRGGLGLGLTLVKGWVELHGGTVEARSEGLGCGAEFILRLPLAQKAEQPALAPDPSSVDSPPLQVLVIEDNRDAADSMRDLLAWKGHAVVTAHTGTEGLEKARRFLPDVVICDIGLPEMDGYAVAKALRDDPATREVHLIMVSGYAQEEDVARSREAGVDVHLMKPVEPEELLNRLRRDEPAGRE